MGVVQIFHDILTHLIPVVPVRGGAEVALKIYMRPFSSIELACAVRQPSRCVRALCETGVLFHMSLLKLHFALRTSQCSLHTTHFALHTSHCTLHTAPFAVNTSLHTVLLRLHTSHSTLHTPHFTLHSSHSKLRTSHSTFHTSQSTLHTSHCFLHTPNFTLHTSHCTLHNPHFTLHSLHIPHFISAELFSPYPADLFSSHLFSYVV